LTFTTAFAWLTWEINLNQNRDKAKPREIEVPVLISGDSDGYRNEENPQILHTLPQMGLFNPSNRLPDDDCCLIFGPTTYWDAPCYGTQL